MLTLLLNELDSIHRSKVQVILLSLFLLVIYY